MHPDVVRSELHRRRVPMIRRQSYKDGVKDGPARWLSVLISKKGQFWYANNKRISGALANAVVVSGVGGGGEAVWCDS